MLFGSSRAQRTASGLAAAVISVSLFVACGEGDSAEPVENTATSVVNEGVLGEIPTPVLEIDLSATQGPLAERRDGSFPVNLKPPGVDVAVWTTIRRAGDPEVDEELMVITEGLLEASTGYVFDYRIVYVDSEGNTYRTEPAMAFGLMAAGERRKFGVAAMMPRDSRLVEIRLTPANGDATRGLVYHIKLRVADIPRSPLLPSGYETAE